MPRYYLFFSIGPGLVFQIAVPILQNLCKLDNLLFHLLEAFICCMSSEGPRYICYESRSSVSHMALFDIAHNKQVYNI